MSQAFAGGCGRTSGYRRLLRVSRWRFSQIAPRAFARKPGIRPPHGFHPYGRIEPPVDTTACEASAPSGARFPKQVAASRGDPADADIHKQTRSRWLAWTALNFGGIAKSEYAFAIYSLYCNPRSGKVQSKNFQMLLLFPTHYFSSTSPSSLLCSSLEK
jgi:hypothetical protein